jgi:hypothetical protein
MTKKAKVIAAVVAVVVVVGGGLGFYLKGGDLMGRLGKMRPAYNENASVAQTCSAMELYGNTYASDDALYEDFDSFYNSVSAVLDSNGGTLDCPYKFSFYSGLNEDYKVTNVYCDKWDVSIKDQFGTKAVICIKSGDGLVLGVDVAKNDIGVVSGELSYTYKTDNGNIYETVHPSSYSIWKMDK